MTKLKKATSWEVKVKGNKRSIQLFDENGNKLNGSDACWEGYFSCFYNKLTSLEGAPKEVGGYFSCSYNNLTSLEGAPKEVGGYFDCSYNKLTSLECAPSEVGGHFDCENNNLTSLEGAPKEVGGHFSCSYNKLTSLECAPSEVGGHFDCSYNKLTSLECAPSEVGGHFDCENNNLTSLEGAPKEYQRKSVQARIFQAKIKKGYVLADGILTNLISKKEKAGITIFKTQKIGSKKIVYVAKRENTFSHGETIKEAIEDLRYKVSDRDKSEFEKWRGNLDLEVSLDDAIAAYRTITGACSSGVKDFVKQVKVPKKLTPNVVIELTKGKFGSNEFERFLKEQGK